MGSFMNLSIQRGSELIPSHTKVCVLGGGISGLALAYRLQNQVHVTLVEKEARVGGWIRSNREEGFFFESGPRSLRSQDSLETLQLIEQLGLNDQLIEAPKEAFCRYLLHKGKLEQVPNSLWKMITSPLTRPFLGTFFKELFSSRSVDEDESVYAFFSRHFSKDLADQFADPLTKGIFAANAKDLSVKACFPKMKAMEAQHRSLILASIFGTRSKEKNTLYTLKGGLEELPKALAKRLGTVIRLSTPVKKIECRSDRVELTFAHGIETFDYVISTLPAHAVHPLLPQSKLKEHLASIPFSSVAVARLGFKKKVNRYEGFGYLVPSKEHSPILGVVFDSSAFPFHNQTAEETRLSLMMEGAGKSSKEVMEIAQRCLASDLGIKEDPDFVSVFHADRAIPQYFVGFPALLKKIEAAQEEFPRFSLLGTSFYGVSVNQAILHAMHYNPFQKSRN